MKNPQQAFVLILLAVSMCYGHDQTYCGRNLAKAIALYCSEIQTEKRSDRSMYNSILAPYYRDQDEPQYDLLWPHYKARAFSVPSRGKRHVVDECCSKPCSVSELQSYCF